MSTPPPRADVSATELEFLAAEAVAAVRAMLGAPAPAALVDPALHPRLARAGAAFVTLRQHARLRGCIGSLEARRPLLADVRENARAAARDDPRFTPLTLGELAVTVLEVSVLSAAEPLTFDDEDTLLAQIEPGRDGLVVHHARARATYLPSVWETLPDPRLFLAELRRKAGIAPDVPTAALAILRYTTTSSRAHPLGAAP